MRLGKRAKEKDAVKRISLNQIFFQRERGFWLIPEAG